MSEPRYPHLHRLHENEQLSGAGNMLQKANFEWCICDAVLFMSSMRGGRKETGKELRAIFERWPKYSGNDGYPIRLTNATPQQPDMGARTQFFLCARWAEHPREKRPGDIQEFMSAYRNLRRELWEFVLECAKEVV